jgi:hypothetical protein
MQERERKEKRPRPYRIARGNVQLYIFANDDGWGKVQWRIKMVHAFIRTPDGREVTSFECDDVPNMMRILYDARRWIRRRDRGNWLRRLLGLY